MFSERFDARPEVRAWLDGLDAETRKSLRDDVTPRIRERPTPCLDDVPSAEADPDDERLSDEVLDAQRFPEMGADVQAAFMRAARENLPDWQFRAFVLWFSGANRNHIARVLGVSRSTVRSALDGEGQRGQRGAIEAVTAAVQGDADLRKVVMRVATKNISKTEKRAPGRVLGWFKGIENKPGMVEPLALLLVLDDLATSEKREVRVADVFPHFPRNKISPCLIVLKALGYAASDGHVIRVHRTPNEGAAS